MRDQTIVEKILSAHCGRELRAGDLCVAELDLIAGTDTKTPKAITLFNELDLPLGARSRTAFAMDHYVPSTNSQRANAQKSMLAFATENGVRCFVPGSGISLQLFMENALLLPGGLGGVADSHASSLGALNACCVALGEIEFATAMATGKTWLKVPETISVRLHGRLRDGVYPKDVAIYLMGLIKTEGASYQVLEFGGDAIGSFGMSDRFTLCNMVSDVGAKTAIMPGDKVTASWFSGRTDKPCSLCQADAGARYARVIDLDLPAVEPMVSRPHSVDNTATVTETAGVPIDVAVIGSCTNSRLEDLAAAADVLRGRQVNPAVRLLVVPASRAVLLAAQSSGIAQDLVTAGAMIMPPSCGPCTSMTQIGVPADGDNIISSANRNFKGRMGNKSASIYLASPATVAASAVNGCITDPRTFKGGTR